MNELCIFQDEVASFPNHIFQDEVPSFPNQVYDR
jgi:hypothetical protein